MKLGTAVVGLIVVGALWQRYRLAPTTVVVITPGEVGPPDRIVGSDTRTQWSLDFLAALGNTAPTADTVNYVNAWQAGEGTEAAFNPLATTQPAEGDSCFNYLSGRCGVRNYPSREVGLQASITTLTNGYYPHILHGLQTNNPEEALHDGELGTWGTGAGNVRRLWIRDFYGVPASTPESLVSNPIDAGLGSAVGFNVQAALNANGGALRHAIVYPGSTWSFNRAIGDPSALELATIIHAGDGWCNLAARYAQVGRSAGLGPRFQDHGAGDLGGGVDNSVAIWNVDGLPGSTEGRQDLELFNPTERTVVLDAVEREGQVFIIATIL